MGREHIRVEVIERELIEVRFNVIDRVVGEGVSVGVGGSTVIEGVEVAVISVPPVVSRVLCI